MIATTKAQRTQRDIYNKLNENKWFVLGFIAWAGLKPCTTLIVSKTAQVKERL
jgi:hypothetical protein